MMRAALLTLLSVVGCAGHQPAEPEPIDVVEPEPLVAAVVVPDVDEEPAEPPPAPLAEGERRVDVEIVGEGPIGCGNCTNRPYELAPLDGSERYWAYYEYCEGDPPLPPSPIPPDALEVGKRYQLTLRQAGADVGTLLVIAAQGLP